MTLIKTAAAIALIGALGGCQTVGSGANPSSPQPASDAPNNQALPVTRTRVDDQAALEKLRGNSGLTLQWIDWNQRGTVDVSQRGPVVHLKGSQIAKDGKGRLELEGDVLSITSDHFIFVGRIAITDTPDPGRRCVKDGAMEFAITQGRKYWRMREFEWCDQLTDYIDIYF